MLLRTRKQNQVIPTFLEGTPGKYVKRESPPVLPSVNAFGGYIRKRSKERRTQTETGGAKRTQSVERSKLSANGLPSSSSPNVHCLQSSVYANAHNYANFDNNNNNFQQNFNNNNNINNNADRINGENALYSNNMATSALQEHQKRQQLLHVATFAQLQNWNYGDNSGQNKPVKRHQSVKENMLSGTCSRRRQKPLACALLQPDQTGGQQNVPAGSVVSLPENVLQPGLQLDRVDPSVSHLLDDDELPLPDNWAVEVTEQGFRYYVDHNNRRTHWIHPLLHEPLPPGWTKIFDQEHGVLYYNEHERRTQLDHPGIATSPSFDEPQQIVSNNTMSNYTSRHQQHYNQSMVTSEPQIAALNANISRATVNSNQQPKAASMQHLSSINTQHLSSINTQQSQPLADTGPAAAADDRGLQAFYHICQEEIPEFLRVYSQAPSGFDHMLEWEMFRLPQLEQYCKMLLSLYKMDIIKVVLKYEEKRTAIDDEIKKRMADQSKKLQSLTESASNIHISSKRA